LPRPNGMVPMAQPPRRGKSPDLGAVRPMAERNHVVARATSPKSLSTTTHHVANLPPEEPDPGNLHVRVREGASEQPLALLGVSRPISNGAALSVAGTWTPSGDNSYIGDTTVTEGTRDFIDASRNGQSERSSCSALRRRRKAWRISSARMPRRRSCLRKRAEKCRSSSDTGGCGSDAKTKRGNFSKPRSTPRKTRRTLPCARWRKLRRNRPRRSASASPPHSPTPVPV
jgi:hypothetical protein